MAKRSVVMNNARLICMYLRNFADTHKGEWPKDLSALVKDGDIPAALLKNISRPDQKPGYVYLRPSKPVDKCSPQALILYEAHEKWGDGVVCLFVDGHSEFVADKAHFEKLLAEAKKNSAPPEPSSPPAAKESPAAK
jgi:hypothetical protein